MLSAHDDAATLEVLDELYLTGPDIQGSRHTTTSVGSSASVESEDPRQLASSIAGPTSHPQANRLLQSLQEHAPGNSIALVSAGDAGNLGECVKTLAYGLANSRQIPVVVVDAAGCFAQAMAPFTRLSSCQLSNASSLNSGVANRRLMPGVYALSADNKVGQQPSDCGRSSGELIRSAADRGILCLVAAGDATSAEVTTLARLCSASVILHTLGNGTRQATLDAVHRLQLAGARRLACVLVA